MRSPRSNAHKRPPFQLPREGMFIVQLWKSESSSGKTYNIESSLGRQIPYLGRADKPNRTPFERQMLIFIKTLGDFFRNQEPKCTAKRLLSSLGKEANLDLPI